jgi:phospholipid-binding lipoprotein MlaA
MRALPRPALLGAVLLAASFAGCATPPPASDPDALADFRQLNDPLEPANRVGYAINNGLDTVILRPLAVAYRYAVPLTIRTHTHNVLSNLNNPVVLANDMLQGKPRRAGDTLMRGLINTTIGVGGIFDVASDWGYPSHDTDFGVTLALWGLPEGPFLFLPVLGPSNPRDASGFGFDVALDPLTWVGKGTAVNALNWGRYGISAIDERTLLLNEIDKIKAGALDPYATFRSLYRQHRGSQIEDTRDDDRATVPAWFAQPTATPLGGAKP